LVLSKEGALCSPFVRNPKLGVFVKKTSFESKSLY
jgi:hypothetical protein